MKIIIADDDAVWVRVLSVYLGGSGHEVLSGRTWAETRALADRDLPDAILLDSSLADGDAKDFCAVLRADPRFDRTALVLVSGAEPEEGHGADRCLLKGEPMGAMVPAILAAAAARRAAGGGK